MVLLPPPAHSYEGVDLSGGLHLFFSPGIFSLAPAQVHRPSIPPVLLKWITVSHVSYSPPGSEFLVPCYRLGQSDGKPPFYPSPQGIAPVPLTR